MGVVLKMRTWSGRRPVFPKLLEEAGKGGKGHMDPSLRSHLSLIS